MMWPSCCGGLSSADLAKVLYVLAAFSVQVAMEKGERGRRAQWIGTTFELLPNHVVLGAPEKMIKEVKEILESWTGKGLKELRSFLGKLAWIAGIIPRMRWTVAAMYAVLTTVLNEEDKELQRAKHRKGDQRPKVGFVAVKGLRTTVLWLRAAFEAPESMLIRQEPLDKIEPVWGVVTDASPKRIGGLLIHSSWTIVEAFEAPVRRHQAAALDIEFQQASGQAVLEALAVLRALQL